MGLLKRFFNQTKKPEGILGALMLRGMNSGHEELADWGFTHLPAIRPAQIADLGCGAGRNAGEMLKKYPMVLGTLSGAAGCFGLAAVCGYTGLIKNKTVKAAAAGGLLLAGTAAGGAALWMGLMYSAFSYDGKRQMSRQIIEGIADYVKLPEGGVGLDVGCGSGALTIACARRNPQARFIGIDRWGREYASFNKPLCEANARAEGVSNTEFRKGDALRLDFPDESFDAVTSNYVYHNIPSSDRQAILLETLRVLKKGGCFALHDIFSEARYGNMQAFVQKLRAMGYEQVELIDTTKGMFMSSGEAGWMALSGSALLVGKK